MDKKEAQVKVDELAEKIINLCEEYGAEIKGYDDGTTWVEIQYRKAFIQSVSADLF